MAKVLYRYKKVVIYNGTIIETKQYDLHYGKLKLESCHREYTNYNDVINDLESGYLEISGWYVNKPFLSKKKYIYESSWTEAFKISPKTFQKLVYDWRYEEVTPSLLDVINNLPVNELLDWLRDSGITFKDLSKTFSAAHKNKKTKILLEDK